MKMMTMMMTSTTKTMMMTIMMMMMTVRHPPSDSHALQLSKRFHRVTANAKNLLEEDNLTEYKVNKMITPDNTEN